MKRSPYYAVFVGFFGEHLQVIKSFTKSSPMEILCRNNEIMSCVELLCPNCRPSRKCFKSCMVLKEMVGQMLRIQNFSPLCQF